MVSLHAFVLAAALTGSSDLILLDFSADWCVPCRGMEPTLERLEEGGYPVRRINIDRSPDLARQFGIGPIPCFVLIRDGREVERVVGATSYDRLIQMYHQAGYAAPSPGGGASPAYSNIRGQSPDRQVLPPIHPARPHTVPLANQPPRGNPPFDSVPMTGGRTTAAPPATVPPAATARTVPLAAQSPPTVAHQLALQATVRLQVSDPTGLSKGTGTIIDVHGNEALVLTCGHIFRESQGKGQILVELFAAGTRGPVTGHLLVYECEQRDFALVSIRPDVSVTPMKVATPTYHPRPGESIFSVGCDHGADPTVRVSTISAVDRYVGPPNIEIQGHPVEGRSGGGLFTTDGRIIGICNAADLQEDHGIYAGLPTIHLALEGIGLREIYLAETTRPNPATGGGVVGIPPTTDALTQIGGPVAISPAAQRIPASAQGASALGQSEMICVVRQPDGTSRVVVIKHPSTDLLQHLAAESQQQARPAQPEGSALAKGPATGHVDIAHRSAPAPASPPVVRAQGF